MSAKRWRLVPFLLSFVAFGGLGFVIRRSIEPPALLPSAAQCKSAHDLKSLVEGLANEVASALATPVPPPNGGSPWEGVAAWLRLYRPLVAAVSELRRSPGPATLAALQRTLGAEPDACLSGSAWPSSEALARVLEQEAATQALSNEGVALLAARGCRTAVERALDETLRADRRLASARSIALSLEQLADPGDPQQRLHQLRGLWTELSSEYSPLAVSWLEGPELGPDWGAAQSLRLTSELGAHAPAGCLPESPARLQQLLAARFSDALGATELFGQSDAGWQASSEVARIASVLDAFFRLEFVRRRAPARCEISTGSASRWDAEGLRRVASVLRDYRKRGQLDRFSVALQDREGSSFPKLWEALPEAACAKITQNLCVELNEAQRALPAKPLPALARARAQAASLEETRPTWFEIAEHARAFGCKPTSFGLHESADGALELLATAKATLDEIQQQALERFSASTNPKDAEPALSPERLNEELRRLRFEFSAVAFGLVEPALGQLALAGVAASSSEEAAKEHAVAAANEPPSIEAWQALLQDLALPAAKERGGAPASDGRSGVFAYERLYAQLLSHLPSPCNVALNAWYEGVFDDSDQLFHRYGRHVASELIRACSTASVVDR